MQVVSYIRQMANSIGKVIVNINNLNMQMSDFTKITTTITPALPAVTG